MSKGSEARYVNILTESQASYLAEFDAGIALCLGSRRDARDIGSRAVVEVASRIDDSMRKHPDPRLLARRMCNNTTKDYWRREAAQRGEGARRTRKVVAFPSRINVTGGEQVIDIIDRHAINPEAQAILRAECREAIAQISPLAAEGLVLTAIAGYNQGAAAEFVGVTRPYLSRLIKKSARTMQQTRSRTAQQLKMG